MKKRLIIYPLGGLGNRMQCIFSAVKMLIENEYEELTIIWSNPDCCINLDDIVKFDNLNINIEHDHKKYNINSELSKEGSAWNITNEYDSVMSCAFLKPKDIEWVYTHINKYAKWKKYPYLNNINIGVHCRRSDWGLYANEHKNILQQQMILDEEFIDYLLPIVKNEDFFFLSTDSRQTAYRFKEVFGHRVLIIAKYNDQIDCVRDRSVMLESMIDLHSLAKCKTIIRDSLSSYSLLSHIIGKTKLMTYDRKRLNTAGAGVILNGEIPLM